MDIRKNKLPLTIAFLVCFLVITLTFNANNVTIPTGSGNDGRPTIVLDAGHGGMDGGCVSADGLMEKDINLKIAVKLEALLTEAGYTVIMTRNSDMSLDDNGGSVRQRKRADITARERLVKNANPLLFVSIHLNKFPDEKIHGAQAFYSEKNPNSKLLAEAIQNSFKVNLDNSNKRLARAADPSIYLMKNITAPAVIAECGFLSNKNEAALLVTDDYQNKAAYAVFMGIRDYLSINN